MEKAFYNPITGKYETGQFTQNENGQLVWNGYGNNTSTGVGFNLNNNDAQNKYWDLATQKMQYDLDQQKNAFLSPNTSQAIGAGIGLANLAMNIGMYGTNKKAAQAQSDYYKNQIAVAQDELNRKKATTSAINNAFK